MSTLNWLRSPRAALAAMALVLAAVLGACGPGVGGTGTGETNGALAFFGASEASVCSGDLAGVLSCAPPSATAAPLPNTAAVYLADAPAGWRVLVRAQGNEIEVTAPCARLQFRGRWGAIGSQAGRFFGYTDPDVVPAPATLQTQLSDAGVSVTLRDAHGLVLLGPVQVTVVPAPGTPSGCG